MQASIERYFEKKKLNKDVFRGRAAVALALAILIIISVFWWLKLTGITMAGEAFCGFTEHRHTEECIERTLICGFEEGEPVPETDSKPTEDAPEVSVNEATEGISDEASTDAVQQSESESEESVPTVSESEAPVGHIHTDECYKITYICGLTEHVHDVSCYSDSKADVESERDWKKTFESVTLTPDFADNLVAIAKTQLGYTESERNYSVDAEKVKHGYSRYGEWYGSVYGDWSAMFVEFCLYYTSGIGDNLPYSTGVETTRMEWEKVGVYQPIAAHAAVKGDILFWDTNGDGKADLTGIVSAADGEQYSVIVGDYNNSVCEITLAKNDASILGSTVKIELLQLVADEETLQRIDRAIEEIDGLESIEAIAEKLVSLEEDPDEYAKYLSEVSLESLTAYAWWEDTDIYRPLVTNADKLDMYSFLWASPLAALDAPTVYQINQYDQATTTLVSGSGTIGDIMGKGMSFTYWDMYIVSKDSTGYYVSEIHEEDVSKLGYKPGNGFILLLYNNSWNVEVGDRVGVNFTITGTHAYKVGGYGSVEKTKTNNLTPIQAVDTSEFIEVNLYNYGNLINSKYNSNGDIGKNYPGFQQEYGTTSIGTTLGSGSFNFGNNITADYDAGINGVTNQGGAINVVNGGNVPVQGAMNYNLVNGYPALAYTANGFDPSLKWLFSNNAATSTTKVNSSNINGLFLYDEESGFYYFDSRLNHAQYNTETGNFDLYKEHLTPNYLMYPFGNFLPFNNINSQSTKVTSINQAYFTSIANAATVKYNNTGRGEYNTLSNVLKTFVTRMGTNFTYLDAVNKYFEVRDIPTGGDPSVFNDMYNLDYDEPSDFYFGMDMHMEFVMTKDGTTGPNGDTPLYFDFNGDDDVWVYVDGKLFLDLSGIHRHVGGRIDFQHGRVEYYEFNAATGQADIPVDTGLKDANGNPYTYTKVVNGVEKTIYYVPFSVFLGDAAAELVDPETGTFYPYSKHSFDFYYMERGSGSSVCRMEFTLPLLQKNSISVTKEMDSTDDLSVLGNPDFYFQILKPDGVTPFIGAGVEYTILDADNQTEIGKGITGANGVFTLKAGQTAVFPNIQEDAGRYFVRELLDTTVFEQYGTVTVDGRSVTKDHYEPNLTVGIGTFKGVDSDLKDISNGSTTFVFTNHIDINKYGSLKVQKNFNDYQSGTPPRDVTFEINLGGEPIPIGTLYTVIRADGVYEARAVETAGQITFASDEIIWFSKLLAGTEVTVRESAASASGYAVTYTASEGFNFDTLTDTDGDYGKGVIPSGQAAVTVGNDREGTKLPVPISKTLLYPDGLEHSYTFLLQQIVGKDDLTPTGFYIKLPVTLTGGTKNAAFTLNFVPGTPDGKYYYLLYEEDADAKDGTDTTRYIVEVTVTTANGITNAEITGRYLKDGTAINGTEPLNFTNRIVRPLTVQKTVHGVQSQDSFTFTVFAQIDGTPLDGSYHAEGPDGAAEIEFVNGEATFSMKHGQSFTVLDLPYGTQWTVTESDVDGYFPKYSVNSAEQINGDEAIGTLSEPVTVAFINVGGYELPSTGSSAHLWFIIAGIALTLIPLIIGYCMRRRDERRLS